jgi:hypothetical protein
MSIHPTSFPAVNALLDKLLSGVRTILGENFVGLYLYGSLASGDFDVERSDVDFVVITVKEISDKAVLALEQMHHELTNSGLKLAAKLEGSYIPQADIRRHTSSEAQYPTINEGQFYLGGLGSDWVIQRHILREQAVIVAGVSPQTLIDPVPPEDLQQSLFDLLNEWWLPMLENPTRLQSGEYQAYAILTMCRVLYTLQNGTIASKPISARWAQENLGERWANLIAQAVNWQHGEHFNKLNETLDFIRFTLERSKKTNAL